jgi:hypothetical protein
VRIALADVDPLSLYRVKASLADPVGRSVTDDRLIGGFAQARRAAGPVEIDGRLVEDDWSRTEAVRIADRRQVYLMGERKVEEWWTGPDDLSADIRFLWDDENLYVSAKVSDDAHHAPKADSGIWNQDGLQFLLDPRRDESEKPGKYDYSMATGTKGPQAWCHLSASESVKTGEATSIRIAVARGGRGDATYEIAVPWTQIAPFRPAPGADLGLAVIANEDDGQGRHGFMGWFSGVHSKQLDMVGDVILTDRRGPR